MDVCSNRLLQPVEKFSVGYLLGLAMHFYELVGKPLNLHDYLDFGLEYWNLADGGWGLFYSSLLGGTNGGEYDLMFEIDR